MAGIEPPASRRAGGPQIHSILGYPFKAQLRTVITQIERIFGPLVLSKKKKSATVQINIW